MLLSIANVPVPPSANVSYIDSHTDRSQVSTLVPPTVLPKHFNVTFAIQHGYFRCVRYLLELSSDPNERDNQLRTPLILCAYVENDRWSLSLAQNLLEKGAKIALEDHARRNAMHHACALQRLHLVQLYLSCLDFNLQARDCEGNTCLHYAAITGNCDIADLLMHTAEKLNIRLDQVVNREGCSAAVLALRYGHIECANQITHRDWDEFFVVPRPLSIYEAPPSPPAASTQKMKVQKKVRNNPSPNNDPRPLSLSFGLLKIIFNEGDANYSTRLAGICKEEKLKTRRRRKKRDLAQPTNSPKTQIDSAKSTLNHEMESCSTEALVNEVQRSAIQEEPAPGGAGNIISGRISPRLQLLKQQYAHDQASNQQDVRKPSDLPSDIHQSFLQKHQSSSTLNQFEESLVQTHESPSKKKKNVRPKTAVQRPGTSTNAVGVPSRLSSEKTSPTPPVPPEKTKKKLLLAQRASSASNAPKTQPAQAPSDISTYSQMFYSGRPLSAAVSHHQHHPLPGPTIDSSYSIREAKGAARRFNNPEELFGLKPEQLFASPDGHTPKLMGEKSGGRNKRFQELKKAHQWQNDVDKLVDLYNIHHSSNYRPSAIPPPPTSPRAPVDTTVETNPMVKLRKTSVSRASVSGGRNLKLSTLATLNAAPRNSLAQRPTIKVAHT